MKTHTEHEQQLKHEE